MPYLLRSFLSVAVFVVLGLMSVTAMAEDILSDLDGDDDIEFSQADESSYKKFWDEHGSATIGGFYLAGGDSGKQLAFFKAGFNYDWTFVKMNLEGSVLSSATQLAVKTDGSGQNRSAINIDRNKVRLISAYLDFKLRDNVSLAVGRQSIVWGQFDIFSPVDFALPMDFDFAGQSIGKLGNRNPQDAAKLSWFPIESIEIQGYYFPTLENMWKDSNEVFGDDGLVFPDSDSDDQSAVRALYYHDWGTIGLTYYDGFNHFWPSRVAEYDPVGGAQINQKNEVYRNRMIGVEVAKPFGRYTFKAEVARHENIEELRTPNAAGAGFAEYVTWLAQKNGNRLYVQSDVYFSAVGVDADLDRWKYSLSIINRTIAYDSVQQEGVDLDEQNDVFSDDDSMGNTFPMFFLQYYLQDERTSHIGAGVGMLSGFIGVTVYYSREVAESLNIFAGVEVGQYWGDSNSDDDEDLELEEFIGGPKFGLSYQF